VIVLGTIGIILYAEMSGRIATVTQRPVFDIVRERLGARIGFVNLAASFMVNVITLVAEIAGVALALELASGLQYYLWVPVAMLLVFWVLWKVPFETMERAVGFLGLTMLVYAVAMWKLHPDWGHVARAIAHPQVPHSETLAKYWYFAIALFGAALTPYEIFFYSSGAVEEKWDDSDLFTNRITSYAGFTFGAVVAIAAVGVAALVFGPQHIRVEEFSTVALGPAKVLGTMGLIAFIAGAFVSTFGSSLEVTLANGYALGQYFGWAWGKLMKPREAARFHVAMIVTLILAGAVVLTSIDPVKVTEIAMVFAVVGLPLSYFPVLVVASDRRYMGDKANGRVLNALSTVFLAIVLVASAAAIPLMVWTKMGS
jgi:Mn2+/Fe2+ NRAMP family transporter